MSFKHHRITLIAGGLIALFFFIWGLNTPLNGNHRWRQADTLFTGYYFCTEDANILNPRISFRNGTDGISIGEFPAYSWLISIPCQLTGNWDEGTPKIISLTLFLLMALFAAKALCWQFFKNEDRWEVFFALILFANLHISYLLRPFPDVLPLFLFALAAYLWRKPNLLRSTWAVNVLGVALCVLGFLIRPYLAPLLIIVVPNIRVGLVALIPVLASYLVWYKYWADTSTIKYYVTHIRSLSEVWATLPQSLTAVGKQLTQFHTNFVALPLFIWGLFEQPKLALLWLFSIVLVIATTAHHFVIHPYYMFAASFIALIIVGRVLLTLPYKWQSIVLSLFVLAGIGGSFHQLRPSIHRLWEKVPAALEGTAVHGDPLVVLNEGGGELLYYTKATGWRAQDTPANRATPCRGDAKAALWKEGKEITVVKCGK